MVELAACQGYKHFVEEPGKNPIEGEGVLVVGTVGVSKERSSLVDMELMVDSSNRVTTTVPTAEKRKGLGLSCDSQEMCCLKFHISLKMFK